MLPASDAADRPLFLVDRQDADRAAALIADFGDGAGLEAARRATLSRDVGNVFRFCRWRQVGRLVELFAGRGAGGTRH